MNHFKLKSEILKSIFGKFCYKFLYKFVHIYKKVKTLSAKYYKENKEKLQKKLAKDIKIFLKTNRKKPSDMVVNVTQISQKMKNKCLCSIEKILWNEKRPYYKK